MTDVDLNIRDLLIELNRALEALRLSYPTISKLTALQDSVVIKDLWEELKEIDMNMAWAWLLKKDPVHLREDLYEGTSLPSGLDSLGAIPDAFFGEDSDNCDHLSQPDCSGFGGQWGGGNEFGIGPDDWAGVEDDDS